MQLLILFIGVLLGGGLALRIRGQNQKYLKWALSFSAAFILAITILHLLPVIYIDFQLSLGLWILAGFFVQILLESLSAGVEHGHIHSKQNASSKWAVQIVLGLSIHAFIEGMPLLGFSEALHVGHSHNFSDSSTYFLSVLLHKVPAAFAMVLLLRHSGFSTKFILFCLIIFACMSPLGALVISSFEISDFTFRAITAFVVGAFLHIATTILFESDKGHHHKIAWDRIIFSLIGLLTAVLAILG